MTITLLFFAMLHLNEDPVEEARRLRDQGDFLMAEGLLLDARMDLSEVGNAGHLLAEIALQIGAVPAKVKFYQTLLFESPALRGMSLYVLAALAAHDGDWVGFQRNTIAFVNEYPQDDCVYRYHLLYYLARFTRASADDLTLSSAEQAWFNASRELPKERVYPRVAPEAVPYPLAYLICLEGMEGCHWPPDNPPADADALYDHHLLRIHDALTRGDTNAAATEVNGLISMRHHGARLDQKVIFYDLLAKLHRAQGQQERALKAEQRRSRIQPHAVLPFQSLPEQMFFPEPDLEAATVVENPEMVTVEPEPITVPPIQDERGDRQAARFRGQLGDYDALESDLLRGVKVDLEKRFAEFPPETSYKRAFAAYLRGLEALRQGRYQSAFSFLGEAEDKVSEFPFPLLQSRVLLALADYYQAERNQDQAEWYRIAAIQLWKEPEILPLLNARPVHGRNPFLCMLDALLDEVTDRSNVQALLYHSEVYHQNRLRTLAFQRACLTKNAVIGNQIQEIGRLLARHGRQLASGSSREVSVRQYNETAQLYRQLWQQVFPSYQSAVTPPLKRIQSALKDTQRLVSFVEGESSLGVLIISKTQAFAVGLGGRGAFVAMNPQQRMDFIASRIGPVWNHHGTLLVVLSPVFQRANLATLLTEQIHDQRKLRFLFSISGFLERGDAQDCLGTAVFTSTSDPVMYDLVQKLPRLSLDWFAEKAATARQFERQLEDHDHLIIHMPITLTDAGLRVEAEGDPFYLHTAAHLNPTLCSLSLVLDPWQNPGPWFDELALINIKGPMAVCITASPNKVSNDPSSVPYSRIQLIP